MRTSALILIALSGMAASACARLARPMEQSLPCPAPDAGGMSQRLVDRFLRMARDSTQRRWLLAQDIDPDQVTVPTLITDERLCGRIAATFGLPIPGAAEGGTFYSSGPYIIYSPWRDYSRRTEWANKGEFVGFVILDRQMKVIGAIAM